MPRPRRTLQNLPPGIILLPSSQPAGLAFDPTRSALLLLGGDKAGNWQRWYRQNISIAEQLYLDYTTEKEE